MNIDFTNCKTLINNFGGSEKKKKIIYNNEIYMIKFPDPVRELKNTLSYMNNQFSEYIGCHIFESCGISVQKTLLGTYYDKIANKNKIVVACRSFENDKLDLVEFSKFMLSSNFDSKNNEKLEFDDIIKIFKEDEQINTIENLKAFYDTIVIDTLIGNGDRHQDNFGFVHNKNELDVDKVKYSPIYDCGSCLSPLLSDEKMQELLKNDEDFKSEEYNMTYRYCKNGYKIFMHEFFKTPDSLLKNSIYKIYKHIDINNINKIIENTPYLDDLHKEYFKKSIKLRYDLIITPAYKRIEKEIKTKNYELQNKEQNRTILK